MHVARFSPAQFPSPLANLHTSKTVSQQKRIYQHPIQTHLSPRSPAVRSSLHIAKPAAPLALPSRSPSRYGQDIRPLIDSSTDTAIECLKHQGVEQRCIHTSSGDIHALDLQGEGNLPTVIIFPGLGSEAVDSRALFQKLRKECRRIVAFDLPGHGRSALPSQVNAKVLNRMMEEAIRQTIPESFTIVGHCAGSCSALNYTLVYPQRVAALILAAPPGGPYKPDQVMRFRRMFRAETQADVREIIQTVWPGSVLRPWLLTDFLRSRLSTENIRRLIDSQFYEKVYTPRELKKIHCPTLVLWGEKETLLPHEFLIHFETHLAPQRSVIKIVPNRDHTNIVSGDMAPAMLEFLRDAEKKTVPRSI